MGEPFAVLMPEEHAGRANPELPVVVLMGWVEAQRDGALLKYAELLAGAGYPSCRSVQPTATAFSPLDRTRRGWALALLRHLEAHGLWPQRRLVLYAFSNGGAFVVEQFLRLAETHPRYVRLPASVAGFVFDSAPAFMHPGALQRVIAASEPPSLRRWLKTSYYAALTRLGPLLSGGGPPRFEAFWQNMERLDWAPCLFLYSADDPLCDGAKVDELVVAKRRRGQDVHAHRWERSGHVSHLRHHTQEYTALLLHFLASLPAAHGAAAGAGAGGAGGGAATVRSRM